MKIRKLNQRGVAHYFLLALVVVGVAMGGTYYLVKSFADTCGSSYPNSSPVSSAASDSHNCEVTSPSSTPNDGVKLACSIGGVPDRATGRQSLTMSLTVTNTGTKSVAPSGSVTARSSAANGTKEVGKVVFNSIAPGKSQTRAVGTYVTVENATVSKLSFSALAYNGKDAKVVFGCVSKEITVAATPMPTIACTINLPKTTYNYGESVTSTVILTNSGTATGSATVRATASVADRSAVVMSDRSYSISAGGKTTVPTLAYVVKPATSANGAVTVSGTYKAGSITKSYNCSKTFSVKVVAYASCTVTNPTTLKRGQAGTAVVTVTNKGPAPLTTQAVAKVIPNKGGAVQLGARGINGMAAGGVTSYKISFTVPSSASSAHVSVSGTTSTNNTYSCSGPTVAVK